MTQQQQPSNLDSILQRVQKLIALADHAGTPHHEAELARSRAEALMLQYRIEEWQVNQQAMSSAQKASLVPVWRTIRICPIDSQYRETYRQLAGYCLHHVDGKGSTANYKDEETGEWWYSLEAVGYDSDLRYAEMLFASYSLAFGGKMEPKVNPNASDAENAYLMRSAGMTGAVIAEKLWGRSDKAAKSKARKLFADHARSLGDDPEPLLGRTGASIAAYRDNYAIGFVREAYSRLHRMRMSTGDSGELVLKSRKDAVQEAWYAKFPYLRPNPAAFNGNQIGMAGGPGGNCAKCRKAKSGYCRDHAYLRPSSRSYREVAFHAAGYARGQAAAQSVDLSSSGSNRRFDAGSDRRAVEG